MFFANRASNIFGRATTFDTIINIDNSDITITITTVGNIYANAGIYYANAPDCAPVAIIVASCIGFYYLVWNISFSTSNVIATSSF